MSLTNLGSGSGKVYITDSSLNIIQYVDNNSVVVRQVLNDGLASGPLSAETLACDTIVFASTGPGTIEITSSVGGSLGGAIAWQGTLATTLAAVSAAIIADAAGYTAVNTATTLIVTAPIGSGAAGNAYVITPLVTGLVTVTSASPTMSGGSATTGIYSTGYNGRRYFLNAATDAPDGDITGATEITASVISHNSTGPIYSEAFTIFSDAITPERVANVQIAVVDTEGGAGTDTLKTISVAGFTDNDIITITTANAARIVTVNETGNIMLANSTSFISGDETTKLTLQYSVALNKWVELARTPGFDYTTAAFRAAGVPQPAWGVTNVTMPVSGTLTLTPGTSKLYQVITGSPVMAAGYNITGGGSPIDGDTFYIIYNATPTAGGNVTTIFGKALTATQTAGGRIAARAVYNAGTTSYVTTLDYDTYGKDLVDTVALALKLTDPGAPAADGYVLYSDIAGPPFWGPTVSNDTGWIDLSGFAWLPVGTRPQYRVINKVLSFRGQVVVPLNNAGAILTYTSEADYSASLTVAPNTAATGGVTTNAAGSITFNQGAAVIPTAAHYPDTDYTYGPFIGTRRVRAQASGAVTIVYTGVFYLTITSAGLLVMTTLNDPENVSGGGVPGSSLFRLVSSNVVAGDYALDFRTIDTAETIQGKTANTALTVLVSNPGTNQHGITMNAADPTQAGGFQAFINPLVGYQD